jgi:hypothetical protein
MPAILEDCDPCDGRIRFPSRIVMGGGVPLRHPIALVRQVRCQPWLRDA